MGRKKLPKMEKVKQIAINPKLWQIKAVGGIEKAKIIALEAVETQANTKIENVIQK